MEGFAVTCPLAPDAPRLISGSCSSSRSFGLGFLQTPPRGNALALLLAFGSAKTWQSDFHRLCNAPCPAHTWRLPARGYEQMTTVGCSPRVRVHRQVRRRYLRRAASSAMATKTIATASMTTPTRMSMAIASRFDRYGARYVDGLSRCRLSPEPR